MKNKLIDLNNHLFLQLERINDEDLKGEDLKNEINRSKAVAQLANQVVANADLALQAEKLHREGQVGELPKMIEGSKDA